MEWPDERSQQLAKLWEDDSLSAAEIAAALGITRNAVLGRAHRMELPSRKVVSRRLGGGPLVQKQRKPRAAPGRTAPFRPLPEPARGPSPAAAPAPRYDIEASASLGLDILDLRRDQCRYPDPAGDPAMGVPFTFCGHRVAPGSSYCQPHKMICTGAGTQSERAASRAGATIDRTQVVEAA